MFRLPSFVALTLHASEPAIFITVPDVTRPQSGQLSERFKVEISSWRYLVVTRKRVNPRADLSILPEKSPPA
jgi:hypothetical protein